MNGTENLAALEDDIDLLRVDLPANVAPARDELMSTESVSGRALLISGWMVRFPSATRQLLRVVAQDPAASAALASSILACGVLDPDDADDVLVTAFPNLIGAVREAAADRDGVRRALGIRDAVTVRPPDPAWLWPVGVPFPSAETVEGVQARLNYLDLGAGPVDGEWTELTRRAFVRWQVLAGFEPTGELDWSASDALEVRTPNAPD